MSVKARRAELLWVYIDVEDVPFNRGFYSVDVKYFYKITAEAYCGVGRPKEICGLASFDKRVILFGSEGNARIFSSKYVAGSPDVPTIEKSNMPTAVVEVVDPLILDAKIVDSHHHHHCGCSCEITEVPRFVGQIFGDDIVLSSGDSKRLYVTLGQFSIIRLERDIQLLMPAYDICMPEKDCSCAGGNCGDEDPCEVFERFAFPVDEFFPPRRPIAGNAPGCGCGCNISDNGCRPPQDDCHKPPKDDCGCRPPRDDRGCCR